MKSKKQEKGEKNHKLFFILFFLCTLAIAVLIVRPFIATLLLSAMLAYILHPLHKRLSSRISFPKVSAFIMILLLLILFLVPVVIIGGVLTKESVDSYGKVKQVFIDKESVDSFCAEGEGVVCSAHSLWSTLISEFPFLMNLDFVKIFTFISAAVFTKLSDFILNIPGLVLHIFITMFALYYMLVEGAGMVDYVKRMLPMKQSHSDRVFQHFNDIIYATIYGAIVLAIVQGIVAGIGFYFFKVSSPILFGLLTVLAAFIPFIGASLVWLFVAGSMLFNGMIIADSSLMWRALGLAAYGALLISTIDNILKPKIIASHAKVHPLLILLGVFGGIALFGVVGVIVGPILLTLFVAVIKIYETEKDNLAL